MDNELPKMPEKMRNQSTNAYTSYALQDLGMKEIEAIVVEFREHLGIEIDWGYIAGRPIISWMPRYPEER